MRFLLKPQIPDVFKMVRVLIQGVAAVFRDSDNKLETAPSVLGRFDGHIYDEERFTDYLGGPEEENALAAALRPSGFLRFEHDGHSPFLTAITEYDAIRRLTDQEIKLLVEYTMGQWSDGIGENFACDTPFNLGVSVQCQTDKPPVVEQFDNR